MGKLTAEQRKKMLQSYVSSLKSRKANITPKTRIAKTLKTSQEENQDDTTNDVVEKPVDEPADAPTEPAPEPKQDEKAAKRLARRIKIKAFKIAQEDHGEELDEIVDVDTEGKDVDEVTEEVAEEATEAVMETIPEDVDVPQEQLEEVIEEAVEDTIEAVAKRKAAKRKLSRKAKRTKKAEESISDDLVKDTPDHGDLPQKDTATEVAVSDDLVEESITPDDTTKDNGEGVKPPSTVEAAQQKFVAALEMVKAEKAAGVIPATVREAAKCNEYMNKYSAKEMKLVAEKLRACGSAQKVAGIKPAKHMPVKHANVEKSTAPNYGALF